MQHGGLGGRPQRLFGDEDQSAENRGEWAVDAKVIAGPVEGR